jgi:hypothetical protein
MVNYTSTNFNLISNAAQVKKTTANHRKVNGVSAYINAANNKNANPNALY